LGDAWGWQRLQAGQRNSGAIAILDKGLKRQPLGLTKTR
jgi:hypothetical protein